MKQKKITVKYEDAKPEVVAFHLDFEELPINSSSEEIK